ncbi:unnamed protein product, partial [Phaeothamnion confervicola]
IDSRQRFSGLTPLSFQHPFDLEATTALQRLPGLEIIVRSLLPVVEQAVYLDNIASGVLVGPDQMSSLHRLLLEACAMLDMEAPELYVRQNPQPNAYTLAVRGKKPFIVLHTSLIDLLDAKELQVM